MDQQTRTGNTASANGVMTAEKYENRMSALDKEHDRRAALVNRSDPDADERLDRLDSWHANMTDMIDAQYCSPRGAADDDVMSAAIAAAEFSGSNDESAEVMTALGGFPRRDTRERVRGLSDTAQSRDVKRMNRRTDTVRRHPRAKNDTVGTFCGTLRTGRAPTRDDTTSRKPREPQSTARTSTEPRTTRSTPTSS